MNGSLHLPQMTATNKVLLIVLGASFLLESILKSTGVDLGAFLGLSLGGVSHGFVFQFISYPLVGRGLIEVLFNGLILWFIGCELEGLWGRKRYLQFICSAAIGGGLVFILLSLLLFGVGSAVTLSGMTGVTGALLLGYAILYPDRIFTFMLIFPMKAKYFCLLLVGIQLYMGFFSPAAALAWGHLGAMFCGIFYMIIVSRKRATPKPRRSHLNLVRGEEDKPKYWH